MCFNISSAIIISTIGTIGFIFYFNFNLAKPNKSLCDFNLANKKVSNKMVQTLSDEKIEKERADKSIQCDIDLLNMGDLEIITTASKNYRWFFLR